MLIFEGPDMTGKTTAAKRLMELFPGKFTYDKFGLPEASYKGIKPWIDRIKPMTIADRFAMSEVIYGMECRGRCNVSPEDLEHIYHYLEAAGGMTVLFRATTEAYERLCETCYDSKVEAFSVDQCKAVNHAYMLTAGHMWPKGRHRFRWDRQFLVMTKSHDAERRVVRPDDDWLMSLGRAYIGRQEAYERLRPR